MMPTFPRDYRKTHQGKAINNRSKGNKTIIAALIIIVVMTAYTLAKRVDHPQPVNKKPVNLWQMFGMNQ